MDSGLVGDVAVEELQSEAEFAGDDGEELLQCIDQVGRGVRVVAADHDSVDEPAGATSCDEHEADPPVVSEPLTGEGDEAVGHTGVLERELHGRGDGGNLQRGGHETYSL